MKLSYNILQDYLGKLPPPGEVARLINLHLTEVEGVVPYDREPEPEPDYIIDIKTLSNRPEYLSYWGVARELAIVLGKKARLPFGKPAKKKERAPAGFSLKVDDRFCSTYLGKLVENVKVAPAPLWLRERLTKSGLQPLNNIVDLANWVMLETGQPLHAFDADRLSGGIVVRLARPKETIRTLEGKAVSLPAGVLVIADQRGPVAIAGVVGGQASGVQPATLRVLIEAATFNPKTIRLGSKKVGLSTDASLRFERRLSPLLPAVALSRFLNLLPEILPEAKIAGGALRFSSKLPASRVIALNLAELNGFIGAEIKPVFVKKVLRALSFRVEGRDKLLKVTVPASRLDVAGLPDLAEEVLRFWGIKKVRPSLNLALKKAPRANLSLQGQGEVKNLLRALGFDEVYTKSLTDPALYQKFDFEAPPLAVEKPLSREQAVLRTKLWLNLLPLARGNQEEEELALFELGKVFLGLDARGESVESYRLAGLLAGKATPEALFRRAKGAVERLFALFGLKLNWRTTIRPHFSSKLEAWSGEEKLGSLGLLSARWAAAFSRETIVLFDLNLDRLIARASPIKEIEPLPRFPQIKLDLAAVVDERTKAEEVYRLISESAGEWLEDLVLFDIFRGLPLPPGKKSLAYHLTLRSHQRTLTDQDREGVETKIKKALKKIDGEIRS